MYNKVRNMELVNVVLLYVQIGVLVVLPKILEYREELTKSSILGQSIIQMILLWPLVLYQEKED